MDMRTPGLMRRGARYYLRVAVPVDLVRTIGRREVWRSLRTADHREAVKKLRRARTELDATFDRARKVRDANGHLAEHEARALVTNWFREADRAAAERDFGTAGDDLGEATQDAAQDAAEARHGLADATATMVAHKLLIGAGWPARAHHVGSIQTKRTQVAEFDHESEEFAKLCDLVRRGFVELARRRGDRLAGEAAEIRDPLFTGNGAAPAVNANGHAQGEGLTVGEALERFRAEKEPAVNDRKRQEYRSLAGMLCEVWGAGRAVRSIDLFWQEIEEYRNKGQV